MSQIVISSGHGLYVRGASGFIDEVDEARRVVEEIARWLRARDVRVSTYHDNVSTTQSENLERIVDCHNSQTRDLDVSVHFNAYETTAVPRGTECLYVTQDTLAVAVAQKISEAGELINRGAKHRGDLYFLNNTESPAILIEVCFVDSEQDVDMYGDHFHGICRGIADAIADAVTDTAYEPAAPEKMQHNIICSVFGGMDDPNYSAYDEHFITDTELGVALPDRFEDEPRPQVRVINRESGIEVTCNIVDVGPWLTDDPYWETGTRPIAETCYWEDTPIPRGPNEGEKSNGAGIDLTPRAAELIGIDGKGEVDWEFVEQEETS